MRIADRYALEAESDIIAIGVSEVLRMVPKEDVVSDIDCEANIELINKVGPLVFGSGSVNPMADARGVTRGT